VRQGKSGRGKRKWRRGKTRKSQRRGMRAKKKRRVRPIRLSMFIFIQVDNSGSYCCSEGTRL